VTQNRSQRKDRSYAWIGDIEPAVDLRPVSDGRQTVGDSCRVVVENSVIASSHDCQHGQVVAGEVQRAEHFAYNRQSPRPISSHTRPSNVDLGCIGLSERYRPYRLRKSLASRQFDVCCAFIYGCERRRFYATKC